MRQWSRAAFSSTRWRAEQRSTVASASVSLGISAIGGLLALKLGDEGIGDLAGSFRGLLHVFCITSELG
jgi:hypothetical protein